MTWVPIFDASDGWPSDPQAVWDAGYRAIAGYINQGSWKSFTPALRDRWITPAHPFALAPMYEVTGTEPVTNPAAGTAHAHAARAGARALGIPDDIAIAYAVDRDVSASQIAGGVKTYFGHVKATDTCPPIGYLENDGASLVDQHIIAGLFTPAAYAWGNPPKLMTPANAPAEVIWTQEHNGVKVGGSGSVDAGHIRTTAPIWWPTTTPPTEDDMALSDDDKTWITGAIGAQFAKVGADVAHSQQFTPKVDATGKPVVPTVYTETLSARMDRLDALTKYVTGGQLAKDIVSALPVGAGGSVTAAEIAQSLHDELGKLGISVTVAP
jgi:Domain of unknown function (DUF1906)